MRELGQKRQVKDKVDLTPGCSFFPKAAARICPNSPSAGAQSEKPRQVLLTLTGRRSSHSEVCQR